MKKFFEGHPLGRAIERWSRVLLFSAIAVGIAGPFGTFLAMPLSIRVAYWLPVLTIGTAVGMMANHLVTERQIIKWQPLRILWAACCLTFVMVPFLFWFHAHFFSYYLIAPMRWFDLASYVFVTTVFVAAASMVVDDVLRPAGTDRIQPRLNARLEDLGDAEVDWLQVKDHYVTVCLSDGRRQKILMRFADAVNEMEGVDGFCVHRSHWVARHAINQITRTSNRHVCELKCGANVPVSKTYQSNLIAAGFNL